MSLEETYHCRGKEEKECHENPTIFKDQGMGTKDNQLWTKDQERLRTKDKGHFFTTNTEKESESEIPKK